MRTMEMIMEILHIALDITIIVLLVRSIRRAHNE